MRYVNINYINVGGCIMNVTNLMNKDESNQLYWDITTFLNRKEIDSVSTKENYEAWLREFFIFMCSKDLPTITRDDIYSIRNVDVIRYQAYLTDRGYKAGTINTKLSAVKSLIDFLSRSDEKISLNTFKVDRVKGEAESYGSLTLEEIDAMLILVREQRNGEEKSLLIELALKTGIRLAALLSLQWSNITKDNESEDLWIVNVIDKGKSIDEKIIVNEFYTRICSLKREEMMDSKIFHLDKKTIQQSMKRLTEELEIDERRNITFHSLKKSGATYIYELTGDIKKAQDYCNHKNCGTTMNTYIKRKKDRSQSSNLLIGQQNSFDLSKLTKEELLKVVEESGNMTKIKMRNVASKLYPNK